MARNKKNIPTYININGFTEDANFVINTAIKYSENKVTSEINIVHLFLALLENVQAGEEILDYLGLSFNDVYKRYEELADNGRYGVHPNPNKCVELNDFSLEMQSIIIDSTKQAIYSRQLVTSETLFKMMMESESSELDFFLAYIDLDVDEINQILKHIVEIPEALKSFVVDLTENENLINAKYYGVDKYTEELIEVLSRKKKANPCLVGEAGVGKTTIVHNLVKKIASGEVPDELKDVHIFYTDGATLLSGTRYRGDFEERMSALLDWACGNNVILFLDEIHTFINSGDNGSGASSAGNMIKRYLADGSIRIIGTTTLKEYHKYIEKDSAFDRRIQRVEVKEPSVDDAILMIKNTISDYEEFHEVLVSEKDIELAVKLSDQYIKDKYLPDKAYMIIDQACAKVKLNGKRKVLKSHDITDVVSKITGVSVKKLDKSEQEQLLDLEGTISKNLIGQKNAVHTVCKAIRKAKVGIHDRNKPLASFLFVGPTGVGKTELCKVLSKEVALGDVPLIKVDMSEYGEKFNVSKLIGSAPGYVGYGEGGQLTEKVKHNPYSIVLFDEIEKAHPDVFNTFLQLLDEGRLTDSEGSTTDFTNCIVVMTSNAGYGLDQMNKKTLGFSTGTNDGKKSQKECEKIAIKELESTFRPEFLNRIDNIVIFDKLSENECKDVTKLLLNKLADRVRDKEIELTFSDDVIDRITKDGYSDKYGARNIRREIESSVEDVISTAILNGRLYAGCKAEVIVNSEIASKIDKSESSCDDDTLEKLYEINIIENKDKEECEVETKNISIHDMQKLDTVDDNDDADIKLTEEDINSTIRELEGMNELGSSGLNGLSSLFGLGENHVSTNKNIYKGSIKRHNSNRRGKGGDETDGGSDDKIPVD